MDADSLTLAHTAALRTISHGRGAQLNAGPTFAQLAEELRTAGLARITPARPAAVVGAGRGPARGPTDRADGADEGPGQQTPTGAHLRAPTLRPRCEIRGVVRLV